MVENTDNKMVYEYGGETPAVYAFPLRFFSVSDIHVYLSTAAAETELVRGTDYTIETKADYSTGANITLITPQPAGSRIVIMRILPLQQTLNLPDQGKLPSSSLEIALDRLMMICQQLAEAGSRAISWSPGQDPDTPPKELLVAAVQAAKDCSALLYQTRELAAQLQSDLADAAQEVADLESRIEAVLAAARQEIAELAASIRVLPADTEITLSAYVWNPVEAASDEDVAANARRWEENQAAIDALPRNLGGHTLTIWLNGTHYTTPETASSSNGTVGNETFILSGFYNGTVILEGSFSNSTINSYDVGVQYNPLLMIHNCSASVIVRDIRFRGSDLCAVYCSNSPAVTFRRCSFHGYFSSVYPWGNGDIYGGAAVVLCNSNAALTNPQDPAFTGESDQPDYNNTFTYDNLDGRSAPLSVRILDSRPNFFGMVRS